MTEYTDSRDRLATIGVLILGVIVTVVAVIALNNPGRNAGDDSRLAARIDSQTSSSSQPIGSSSAAHSSSAPVSSSSSVNTHVTFPSSSSSAQSSSSSSGAPTGAVPPAKSFPLVVMNNTSTTGLAGDAETRFEARGWTVSHIGTMTNDIASTCAYYDPAVSGAKEAAEELQSEFPEIKRVAPRFAELYTGPVVVVLTWDYKPA